MYCGGIVSAAFFVLLSALRAGLFDPELAQAFNIEAAYIDHLVYNITTQTRPSVHGSKMFSRILSAFS